MMFIPFRRKKKKLHPFFWVLAGVVTVGAYLTLRPFLAMALLAFVVATLSGGYYDWLLNRWGGRKGAAAIAGVMTMMVLFLVPVGFLINIIVRQVVTFSSDVVRLVGSGDYSVEQVVDGVNYYLNKVPLSLPEVKVDQVQDSVLQIAKTVGNFTLENVGAIGSGSLGVASQVFIFAVFLYIFMPSVGQMKDLLFKLSPLDEDINRLYYSRVLVLMQSMLKGALVVTLAQAVAAILLLWIAGVSYLGFWFLLMLATFIIPLGPTFIATPIGLVLLLSGQIWQGLLVMLGSMLVVGSIDNFLRPLLVSREAELRPVWVLLGVFGGLPLFGWLGFIFGPVIMVLLKTTIEVYLGRRA